MPLYNKATTIVRTLNSVFDQNYKDFDILIINDGSTDESLELVKNINYHRIIIHSQENKGVSATRNNAILFARENNYKRIAFLDGDDFWCSNHLSTLCALFDKFPEAHIAATNYQLKRSRKTIDTVLSNFESTEDQLLKSFFHHNYLNSIFTCSTLMIKPEIVDKTGLFNESLTHFEDIDWFVRIGMKSKIAFSFRVTAVIDEIADNRSDQVEMKYRKLPDFTDYEAEAKNHLGLEKYIDLNRFAIALAYRMENDIRNTTLYQQKINLKNLSLKQQQLLKMSSLQLKSLKRTQKVLGNLGLHLRAGD
ncbi:glycosyltransferase family A protein [Nonlabens sp.]|uniref:glycosyltransferase family A protein n=1 Tax=Nonlabens sp. TaxID=1888209 RepID=UPI003F69DC1D